MINPIPIQATTGSSVASGDSSGGATQAAEASSFVSALSLAMGSLAALQVEAPKEVLEKNPHECPKADSTENLSAMPLDGAIFLQPMLVTKTDLEGSEMFEMAVREQESVVATPEIRSSDKSIPQVVRQISGFSSLADVAGTDSELLLDPIPGPWASDGGKLFATEVKAPLSSHSVSSMEDQTTVELFAPAISKTRPNVQAATSNRELVRYSEPANDLGLRFEVVDTGLEAQLISGNDAKDNTESLPSFVKEIAFLVEHTERSKTSAIADSSSGPDDVIDTSVPIAAQHHGQSLKAEYPDGLQTETKQIPDMPLHRQVIDQVVKEIRLHRLPERSDLVVKLNPPELGTLRVHITQDANGIYSQIQANNEQVKNLLQAHLPMLTNALADAGLRMDSVSVTSDAAFNTFLQSPAHENGQQEWQGQRNRSAYQGAAGFQSAGDFSSPITPADLSAYDWLV
jgi:hypothetical protein